MHEYHWFAVFTDYEGRQEDVPIRSHDPGVPHCIVLTRRHIGAFIKVIAIPVRNDGAHGDPSTMVTESKVAKGPPRCYALAVEGNVAVGGTLRGMYRYSGGKEGRSIARWYKERKPFKKELLVQGPASLMSQYIVKADDVGHQIVFEVTPIRNDGLYGQVEQFHTAEVRY
eukprot:TRINITY_DN104629_c0_g1_i1.p1 TRINITY_DN104629_c0_g1~~TRINITY_DN104629_c0_g1_i1.p1  ORF type:complete len:197 (+),score=24.87 TRINITY_DN104629_c0_g1_i1:84-593(+)